MSNTQPTNTTGGKGKYAKTGLAAHIDDAREFAPDGASVADIAAIADAAAHGEGEPRALWRERWDAEAEEVVS